MSNGSALYLCPAPDLQGESYDHVLDNRSSDTSHSAQQHGAEVISHACEQEKRLISCSTKAARNTHLIHSDVILLHGWYDL